ncbi:MAG TPA: DOMON-like domain-containing protein [Allosphingosinicella sp.]|jgi:hypothetical protein
MPHRLTLHPESVCEAVTSIEVDVVRGSADVLGLRYVVLGGIGGLVLPPRARSERTDGLWQHACFEAFLGDEEGEGYAELNVSPSTQWAGYRFTSYRSERKEALLPPPRIELDLCDDRLELRVALRLRPGGARRLGLSAVIEEEGGRLSYWALAHPPGKADFHHPDCFALELAAAGGG